MTGRAVAGYAGAAVAVTCLTIAAISVERPLVVAGACAIVIVAPLLLGRRQRHPWPSSPGKRTVLGIAAALIVSTALGLIVARSGLQVFAAFSLAKRFALPITYLIFGLLLIWPHRRWTNTGRPPLWWWLLAAMLGVSTLAAALDPRQLILTSSLAQSAALVGGILIIAAVGARGAAVDNRRRLTNVLLVGAVTGAVLGVGLGPFVAMHVPATFAALYLAVRGDRHRGLMGLVALSLGVLLVQELRVEGASLAVVTQTAVCAAIVLLLAVPRPMRFVLVAGSCVLAVALAVRFEAWALLTGDYGAFSDVTIAHRAYEAAAAWTLLNDDSLSLLVGLGPAATVDLSQSPDVSTLAASGRDVTAVDDVHLLTSWLLLKFGILGLVWLVVFLAAFVARTAAVLRQRRTRWDVPLLMFAAAGVVSALPAATNLWANPLPLLLLALLSAPLSEDYSTRMSKISTAAEPVKVPMLR